MPAAFDWWLYLSFNWQATKGYKHIQKTSCLAIPVNAKMLLSRQNRISNDHRATRCMRDSSSANRPPWPCSKQQMQASQQGSPISGLPPLAIQHIAEPTCSLCRLWKRKKGSQCNHVRRHKGLAE